MNGRLILLLVTFLVLGPWGEKTVYAEARSLTLMECIKLSVDRDPEAQNAKARIDIGKIKKSEAYQKFLPKLDVQTVQSPQLDYFGRPVTDQTLWSTSIGLEQPLYAGGTLWNSVKLADTESHRFDWEYRVRAANAAVEAIQAYYQALTAQQTIQQYGALLKAGEEDLREGQARLTAGMATRADVLELEVKLLETRQKYSKALAAYQVALSGVKKLTGLPDELELLLSRHYPLPDFRESLPQLLDEGQTRRPLMAYHREDTRYNQLRVEVEKGKRLPQLSLVARQEWENPDALFKGKKDWIVLLKGTISLGNTTLSYNEQRVELFPNLYAFPGPLRTARTYAFSVRTLKYSIFDRSSNRVQLEEARADRELSNNRWQEAQRQAYYDVKDAWAQKEDSLARQKTAQKQIALAEELVKINRTKYGLGLATLVEVFKARASLTEAQVSLATATNDHAIALGNLYRAAGRNLTFRESGL